MPNLYCLKYQIVVFLIACLAYSSFGQNSVSIDKRAIFEMDNLGYIYVGLNEQVTQLNEAGDTLNQYSNKSLGYLDGIDASNPHKILVHYPGNSVVTFLDNKLGPRSDDLYLQEKGLEQSSVVCASYNNGLWVYDKVYLGMFRLNQNLEVNIETGNLTQVLGKSLDPVKMQEVGKWLYVADSEDGIYVFDIFGAFYKRIPISGISDFQIESGYLFYLKEGILFRSQLNRPELEDLKIELEGIQQFRMRENKAFIVKEGVLKIIPAPFPN